MIIMMMKVFLALLIYMQSKGVKFSEMAFSFTFRFKVEGDTKCPKILVSLCYKPTSGRIYMRLIQGQDFPSSAHGM